MVLWRTWLRLFPSTRFIAIAEAAMILPAPVRLFLLLACAVLFLAACKEDDIEKLAAGLPPPPLTCADVPGYSVIANAPTVNGDGSLTFGATGTILFGAPFQSGGVVRMCARGVIGSASGITAGLLNDNTGNGGYFITATQSGADTLAVVINDDNTGSNCPSRNFNGPPFTPGTPFFFVYRIDQTGSFPVVKVWLKKPLPGEPPILNTNDPGYCQGVVTGTPWGNSATRRASFKGTTVTLQGAEFGSLQ